MQRFLASDAKYAYSREHAAIGTVEPGELFEVESVEGWSGFFRTPSDFTPETYAVAETHKWAVTGPISVAGAQPGDAIAITIHSVEITTPGVCVYGPYSDDDPLAWWEDETAVNIYPVANGVVCFDQHTTLPTRPLVGCLAVAPAGDGVHAKHQGVYGGNLDCRDLCADATLVLPVFHPGGGLYFGDCKALMGDGEIVGPPEVGAVVTASARHRPRPARMRWPRLETTQTLTTIVSATPLEWSARQAFRELVDWVEDEYNLPRAKAGLLLGMVAHAGICQVSNDNYTAYCTMPRDVLAPYTVRQGS
jgi:amidase